MKIIKSFAAAALVIIFAMSAGVEAEVDLKEAKKIAEKSLKKLIDQSYHYRMEYDTVIVLPVHSKTIWKNDFYLLYFLKDDYFQVEMEIDKETGTPAILSMGKMAPPYHEMHTGTFNHRYFCADSMLQSTTIRNRIEQDSVRLVYFGVIPKLGKRGVVWEVFSSEGASYISLSGPSISFEQMVRDINLTQQKRGNIVADSIRMIDIMAEISRLGTLTDSEKRELQLYPQTLDSLIAALKDERKELIIKFPKLGRHFPLE